MAVGLARIMAEFVATQLNHVSLTQSLDMVSVCYKFTNVGVLGAMFFDVGLEEAYARVLRDCRDGYEGFDMFGDHPVSFWPPGCPVKVREGSYETMMEQTRYGEGTFFCMSRTLTLAAGHYTGPDAACGPYPLETSLIYLERYLTSTSPRTKAAVRRL